MDDDGGDEVDATRCKYCKYVAVLMVDPPAMIVIGCVSVVSVPSSCSTDGVGCVTVVVTTAGM